MEESEQITALEAVELESKETASGRKLFIAVATSYNRSEELGVRGRVFVIFNSLGSPVRYNRCCS